MTKYHVHLDYESRQQLLSLTSKGKISARKLNRARVLLYADEGRSNKDIANLLGLCPSTVSTIKRRFVGAGIQNAVVEKPRPGQPPKLSGRQEAQLITIACSTPPQGWGRWTLRMLADKLVELQVVEAISHETVREVLKKMNSSRG